MSYIYVASSWRNPIYPNIVQAIQAAGHEVYDFRNPPKATGFSWSKIDPNWITWSAAEYVQALYSPTATAGFNSDMEALRRAEAVVLVLPCGRSAHLELGWAAGAGKPTAILTRDGEEPELMAAMCDLVTADLSEMIGWLG